ncbi:MAG: sugar kinase [Candidatus Krumholzibacteriota bacterium]|nr:sugar kinase [Candidatus Krumholzibacteriota bacterium]
MSLVIVGSIAFDTIETPVERVERVLGGSATYSSMVASFFSPVELVGVVGEDFTARYRAVLESKGIGLEGLETIKGGKTFFWEGRYGENPNDRETLILELNVFEQFRPVLPDKARKAGWVFLGNIDPEIQIDLLDQIDGDARVGCDTMDFWIESKPEKLRELLKRVDIVFINDSEARLLSGEINLVKAGKKILLMGPSATVIKKGEHGAMLISEENIFLTPAYPIDEVKDPTGAGDSFAGGFMGYLASRGELDEKSLKKAMMIATVCASFTCEKFSVAALEDLSSEEIERRLQSLQAMVSL